MAMVQQIHPSLWRPAPISLPTLFALPRLSVLGTTIFAPRHRDFVFRKNVHVEGSYTVVALTSRLVLVLHTELLDQ